MNTPKTRQIRSQLWKIEESIKVSPIIGLLAIEIGYFQTNLGNVNWQMNYKYIQNDEGSLNCALTAYHRDESRGVF